MYALVLTKDIININLPGWTFGDIYFTNGAQSMIEANADIDSMLEQVIEGYYGRISADEEDLAKMNAARNAGRRFVAIFDEPQGTFYFSINENGRTIVCEISER